MYLQLRDVQFIDVTGCTMTVMRKCTRSFVPYLANHQKMYMQLCALQFISVTGCTRTIMGKCARSYVLYLANHQKMYMQLGDIQCIRVMGRTMTITRKYTSRAMCCTVYRYNGQCSYVPYSLSLLAPVLWPSWENVHVATCRTMYILSVVFVKFC